MKQVSTLLFMFFLCLTLKAQEPLKIGKQLWMTKNLNVTHFQNGDPILEAKNPEEWEEAGMKRIPAWCYYENLIGNGVKFQKLYNWFAIIDKRGLAPEGWHIPTDTEWGYFINHLGGETIATQKMVEIGFNIQAGGYRLSTGEFRYAGDYALWWSSSTSSEINAWSRIINLRGAKAIKAGNNKKTGLAVRCVKNQ